MPLVQSTVGGKEGEKEGKKPSDIYGRGPSHTLFLLLLFLLWRGRKRSLFSVYLGKKEEGRGFSERAVSSCPPSSSLLYFLGGREVTKKPEKKSPALSRHCRRREKEGERRKKRKSRGHAFPCRLRVRKRGRRRTGEKAEEGEDMDTSREREGRRRREKHKSRGARGVFMRCKREILHCFRSSSSEA